MITAQLQPGEAVVQAFIEFIAGLVALLATAALGHLGVDLERAPAEPREIHRTSDCPDRPNATEAALEANQDC